MSKIKKMKYCEYIFFTICYILFMVYYIGMHFYEGKSVLTEGTDGVAQYYPSMCYIAKWLKSVFINFLQGDLQIPLIDYTLGMGDDVLVVLNYYGFGDPFYLLSVFVSEEGMPYFFTVLFFMRGYLGGITFILMAKSIISHKSISAYVLGAVVYVSSGYMLIANLYYNFIHAIVYIPLMFYGVERIIKSGRKRWTICTVFFFALSGFFYLYVGMLACLVYMVFRYFIVKVDLKKYCFKCMSWGASFLTGLFLAAFIFLPEVMGYLECTRERGNKVPLLYQLQQYRIMFFKLFFAKEANFQVLSLPIIAIIIIGMILLLEKNYKEKVILFLSGITFILPVFSWIMSGFGGIYDRWEIVLVLLYSGMVVKYWEDLFRLTKIQKLGLLNLYIIFLIAGYYEGLLKGDRYYKDTIIVYTIVWLCVLLSSYLYQKNIKRQLVIGGMFFISIVSVFEQISFNLRMYETDFVQKRNVVDELLGDEVESFYRVDNEQVFNQKEPLLNLGFAQGYNGLGEYFSIISKDYVLALSDWKVLSENSYHSYGINHRTILETLCSVKYIILEDGHQYLKPYGFEYKKSTEDGIWKVYENMHSLPIGYTYTDSIGYDKYTELDAIEKQLAMLEVVALDGYTGETKINDNAAWNYEKGKIEIVECQGVTISESGNYIAEAGSSIKLNVELKAGCENYFVLKGEDTSIILTHRDSSEFLEGVSVGTLGYTSYNEEIEVNVYFTNDIVFEEEQLFIGYLPLKGYEKAVQNLKAEQLEDIKFSANKVSGNLNVNKEKILCMSIPYSKGWKAKIDGEEVPIYKANSMFMAIEIPKGKHSVEFIYCTPWLKLGAVISGITLVLCIVYLKVRKSRYKSE